MSVGTGLGLFSLAKRVEALGGHYGVRNRPDGVQGSIFWFAIPYKPDEMVGITYIFNLLSNGIQNIFHLIMYGLGCTV